MNHKYFIQMHLQSIGVFKPLCAVAGLALTLGLTGTPAAADPVDGFYLSGSAALADIRDQTIDSVDTRFGPQPGGYLSTDKGYGGGIAAGFGFGNGLRTELEFSYRRASFDQATAGALTDATTDGHFSQKSLFANAYFDFTIAESPITPYVGAGLGISSVSWNDAISYNATERVGHDSSDTAAAAQFMIGASYAIPADQRWTISTELRHTRILSDLKFDGRVLQSRFGSFPITTNVSDTYRNEVVLTLRRAF